MLNHKNLQKNLCRKGSAADSKIVGTSSWTIGIIDSTGWVVAIDIVWSEQIQAASRSVT